MAAPYPQPGQGPADPSAQYPPQPQAQPGQPGGGYPPQGQYAQPQQGYPPQGYPQQPGQYPAQYPPQGGQMQYAPQPGGYPGQQPMYAQPQMMVAQPGVVVSANPMAMGMVAVVAAAPARTRAPFKCTLGFVLALVILGWLLQIVAVATVNWWSVGADGFSLTFSLYNICPPFSFGIGSCLNYRDISSILTDQFPSVKQPIQHATAGLAFGIMAILLSFTCWIVICVALCSSGDLRKGVLGLVIPTTFTSMLCMALGLSLKKDLNSLLSIITLDNSVSFLAPVAGYSAALGIISWLLFLTALGLTVFSLKYPATVPA